MIIAFDKYQIRKFNVNDIESLVKYANNLNVSRFLRDSFPFPYKKSDAEMWIDFVLKNQNSLSFAIADEIESIGGIGAIRFDDVHRFTAEIGFWLGEPFWNKGIVSAALKTFCNYLFDRYEFNHLTANVFKGNTASKKVLEKTGFVLEGIQRKGVYKQDKFLDLYNFGLLKENFIYDSKSC